MGCHLNVSVIYHRRSLSHSSLVSYFFPSLFLARSPNLNRTFFATFHIPHLFRRRLFKPYRVPDTIILWCKSPMSQYRLCFHTSSNQRLIGHNFTKRSPIAKKTPRCASFPAYIVGSTLRFSILVQQRNEKLNMCVISHLSGVHEIITIIRKLIEYRNECGRTHAVLSATLFVPSIHRTLETSNI